ncbi:C-factor-like [Argiope bruennichi]|uniref:C-factor like protein n=1 Tax=Argiope bruennichi TaxID=94029 RepID=A0A8T0EF83_ARGBR|nr:C-factor-like [Argiope bruennichi]KAF8771283.1 C-factor like protein [Argiope bruennichi]
MEVESVMVTGANKGIGLELVKELVKLPKPPRFVFATYRDESTTQALKEIKDASKDTEVVPVKMDITKTIEIADARKIVESKVGDKGLNLLINNAGVLAMQGFPEITKENMLLHFSTNTIGPVMVLKEMLPLLQKSAAQKDSGMNISRAAALNISSSGGSMDSLSREQSKQFLAAMGYRTSKASLNMAMKVVALTVKDQGILVVNMCPGWVKTDMGTDFAQLTLSESISSILKTLPQLNESHHGAFLDRNGKVIPY